MSLVIGDSPCLTVGGRIRAVRQIRHMTQKELGVCAGIAEPTIRRYELGMLNPKYETLTKIAKALDCPVQFLYDGNPKVGDMTPNWKIGKRTLLEIELDSDLLRSIQTYAKDAKRTVNEEIEDILWWEINNRMEEEMNTEIHAEVNAEQHLHYSQGVKPEEDG